MLIGSWVFTQPSKGDCEREEQRQQEDEDLQGHFSVKENSFSSKPQTS